MATGNWKEKIERWQLLATIYLGQKKRVLIKDIQNNWYFADLLLSGDDTLTFKCYAPSQRVGQTYTMPWAKITYFDEVVDHG